MIFRNKFDDDFGYFFALVASGHIIIGIIFSIFYNVRHSNVKEICQDTVIQTRPFSDKSVLEYKVVKVCRDSIVNNK
jgi:hypothetical protein